MVGSDVKGGNLLIKGTREDVIHALGGDLGPTMDVCPGRVRTYYKFYPEGLYTSRCMELCGVGHSHMPISFIVKRN